MSIVTGTARRSLRSEMCRETSGVSRNMEHLTPPELEPPRSYSITFNPYGIGIDSEREMRQVGHGTPPASKKMALIPSCHPGQASA
jgi:hypothetical protein